MKLYAQILSRMQRLGPNSYKVLAAFGIRGTSAILAFALSWTLARLYGAEGFGIYSVAVTTAVFTCYVSVFGQDYVSLRSVAGELKVGNHGIARGVVRKATSIAVGGAIIAGTIIAVAGYVLGTRIGRDASSNMLVLVAPAVLGLTLARIASWSLRGAGNIVVSQMLEGVTTPATMLVVVLGTLALGSLLPLSSVVALYVAATFAGAALGWVTWRRLTKAWPAAEPAAAMGLLAAGIPMMISNVSNAAADWAAIFSTSLFDGPAGAGQLRVALQLMLAVSLLTSSFDAIMGPQVAAAWKVRDLDALRRVFRKATIGMTVLAAPILLVEFLFPEWLMALFGADFVGGADALRILVIGQLFAVAGGPIGTVLIMSGNDKWLIGYSLASSLVIALLCVTVVPAYGATGGAMVIAGNMIFRRTMAQIILRFVVGLKLSVWRRPRD